jgi:hypothetical protein
MVVNVEKQDSASTRAMASNSAVLLVHRMRGRTRYSKNQEPALSDLLADPILQRLLASDGIAPQRLVELISEMRERMGRAQA